MRKWIVIVVVIVVALIAYNYVNQDHRDIESETATFSLTAKDITNEFEINPSESETKYLNKTISISGTITALASEQVTLNNKIFCQVKGETKELKLGQNINLKGRFIGYDNLLEEIKLDQCYIIN